MILEIWEQLSHTQWLPAEMDVDRRQHATVGEQLDGSDSDTLIALAGRRPRQSVHVGPSEHRGGMGHHEHRDREPASGGEHPVGGLRRWRAGRVVDGGDAVAQQPVRCHLDMVGPPIGIREGGQRLGMCLAPGALDEQAIGGPVEVPTDGTTRRIGDDRPMPSWSRPRESTTASCKL